MPLRWRIILSMLVIVPIGFALKFYRGPAQGFVNNWSSSLAYEIFWMLVAFWFVPRRQAIRWITLGVFVGTCILEVMQLWHPPLLEAIRRTFIGACVLGTTFDPPDFAAYAVGCALGYGWLRGLSGRRRKPSSRPHRGDDLDHQEENEGDPGGEEDGVGEVGSSHALLSPFRPTCWRSGGR